MRITKRKEQDDALAQQQARPQMDRLFDLPHIVRQQHRSIFPKYLGTNVFGQIYARFVPSCPTSGLFFPPS